MILRDHLVFDHVVLTFSQLHESEEEVIGRVPKLFILLLDDLILAAVLIVICEPEFKPLACPFEVAFYKSVNYEKVTLEHFP